MVSPGKYGSGCSNGEYTEDSVRCCCWRVMERLCSVRPHQEPNHSEPIMYSDY